MKPIVIVTGATGGIGYHLAKRLITKYKYRVVGVGRNQTRLQTIAAELGEDFIPHAMDVTDYDGWQNLSQSFAAVDGLIHCAGYLPDFAPVVSTNEDWDKTMAVNFDACRTGTEILFQNLLIAPKPFIIGVASVDGIAPLAGTGAYAVAKTATLAYFRLLREENRGKIRVSVACPGVTDTPLFARQTHLNGADKLIHVIATPPHKAARRILRRARRGKGLIVTGFDGHLLSFGMRLCPDTTLRLCRWVMKRSGLPLFSPIFKK